MSDSKILEVLNEARRKLAEVGWVQGRFQQCKGGQIVGYCSLGAIEASGGIHNSTVQNCFLCAVERELRCAIGTDATVASWNDYEGRTKDEVIEAFDKAIKNMEDRCKLSSGLTES